MEIIEKEDLINGKLASFMIDPNTRNPLEVMILDNSKAVIEPVTERLLRFMSKSNFEAPPDWKGFKFFSE